MAQPLATLGPFCPNARQLISNACTHADIEKVEALMKSIEEIGLQEPIGKWCGQVWKEPVYGLNHHDHCYSLPRRPRSDVLLVDGRYYGFSGCHRYEV